MNMLFQSTCLLFASSMVVSASKNGGDYACDADLLASDNVCIFTLTGDQPEEWIQHTVLHNVNRSVGPDFYRGVESFEGVLLPVTPKPWANGDVLVGTTDPVTGDFWSGYALIFEMIAPLRDMMMYNPTPLTDDKDTWLKWTRALTDCNSKTADYISRSGGRAFSTSQVYEYLLDPKGKGISHHFILQYLEEGTFDLLCLSTDYDADHCTAIRTTAGNVIGERCNCWFDAYKALYGKCPVFDMEFTTCPNTVAPIECAGLVPVDTSDLGPLTETETGTPEPDDTEPDTGTPAPDDTETETGTPEPDDTETETAPPDDTEVTTPSNPSKPPKPKPKPKTKPKPKPKKRFGRPYGR